jgi:hypothetical protein
LRVIDPSVSFKVNIWMAVAQGIGFGIGIGLATDGLVLLLFRLGVLKP